MSSTLKDPKTGESPNPANVETSPGKQKPKHEVTFPPVDSSQYATRRDQLGNKAEKGGKGRGKGRGRGKQPSKTEEVATSSEGPIVRRKTAAKSKASPKDDAGTEERPQIRRAKRHIGDDDDDDKEKENAKEGNEKTDAVEKEPKKRRTRGGKDNKDEVNGKKKPARKQSKDDEGKNKKARDAKGVKGQHDAKGKDKKGKNAKGKDDKKTKVKGQAKAKAKGTKKQQAADPNPDAPTTPSQSKRKPVPESPPFELDASLELTRDQVTTEVYQCLQHCKESGELGTKGKHTHKTPAIDCKEVLQLSVYWSRAAVGLKHGGAGNWNQVCYFGRTTRCTCTNIVLAKHWVIAQVVLTNHGNVSVDQSILDFHSFLIIVFRLPWWDYSQPILGHRFASKAEHYLSMEEPRDPHGDSLEKLKLVLGSAHCEAVERFKREESN